MIPIVNPSLRAADADTPVHGPVRFIGRTGLVKNLAARCSAWQSVLLYGGPKLGKTSLLLQLRWVLERQQTPSWTQPPVQYLDLADPDPRRRFLLGEWDRVQTLLLDNCDALLEGGERLIEKRTRDAQRGVASQAVVWAGGRLWYDYVKTAKTEWNLHPAPLAVLLPGEAQALVGPALAQSRAEVVLQHGGTHPYVLKVLRAQFQSAELKAGVQSVLRAATEKLAPFFESCANMVGPAEGRLLRWLVKKGKPVNPKDAAKALNVGSVKQTADVLCYLGLISRWNLDDGAKLDANCKLFNEWYAATDGR